MSGSGAALRGDFTLREKLDGQDEKCWTLRFDFNALCDFEDETGYNALAFIEKIDGGTDVSARTLRTLFWCALRQKHPEATRADAGRLMTQNPTSLMEAMASAMPDPPEAGEDASGN